MDVELRIGEEGFETMPVKSSGSVMSSKETVCGAGRLYREAINGDRLSRGNNDTSTNCTKLAGHEVMLSARSYA